MCTNVLRSPQDVRACIGPFIFQTAYPNLGSLEIRASTYISAKLKKRTYMYDSLQFPVEMNTRGSKTLTTFIPFHTKYDLQEQFWLFSHSYLQNGMLWLQNNFNILHDLKTDTFDRYVVVTYTDSYVWVY